MVPLHLGIQKLSIDILLDSGASACFINEDFAKFHKFPLVKKLNPIHIEVINGIITGSMPIWYIRMSGRGLNLGTKAAGSNIVGGPGCLLLLQSSLSSSLSCLDGFRPSLA